VGTTKRWFFLKNLTLQGLYVKARATAWALEGNFAGDFDPMKESSANDRIAASLVRDLLQLGRPNIE
jgi:hypothetical protein